jgi:hypothetical protein
MRHVERTSIKTLMTLLTKIVRANTAKNADPSFKTMTTQKAYTIDIIKKMMLVKDNDIRNPSGATTLRKKTRNHVRSIPAQVSILTPPNHHSPKGMPNQVTAIARL